MAKHRSEEDSPRSSRHRDSVNEIPPLVEFGGGSARTSPPLAVAATRQSVINSISRMIDLIDLIDSGSDISLRRLVKQGADSWIDIANSGRLEGGDDLGRSGADGDRIADRPAEWTSDGLINQDWWRDAIVNTMTNEDQSVLRRAQELVRKHDDEVRAQRLEREGRVRQTASLVATYSADCSLRLAELLEFSEKDGPVDKIKWQLSEAGEKLISFNPEDNDLMVDMHRTPMLVTNVEGYTVGVQHLLGTDVYSFGLTCGGDNWSGFEDLEGFGRATLTPGNRYKWSEVALSQYND